MNVNIVIGKPHITRIFNMNLRKLEILAQITQLEQLLQKQKKTHVGLFIENITSKSDFNKIQTMLLKANIVWIDSGNEMIMMPRETISIIAYHNRLATSSESFNSARTGSDRLGYQDLERHSCKQIIDLIERKSNE